MQRAIRPETRPETRPEIRPRPKTRLKPGPKPRLICPFCAHESCEIEPVDEAVLRAYKIKPEVQPRPGWVVICGHCFAIGPTGPVPEHAKREWLELVRYVCSKANR